MQMSQKLCYKENIAAKSDLVVKDLHLVHKKQTCLYIYKDLMSNLNTANKSVGK